MCSSLCLQSLLTITFVKRCRKAWRCRQIGPDVMGVYSNVREGSCRSFLIGWVLYSSFALGCNGPAGRFAVSSGCPRDWQGELCARASQSLTVREGLKCFVRRGPRIDSFGVVSLLRLNTPLPYSDFLSCSLFPSCVVCLILNSCILRISNPEFWSRLCSHDPPGISVCSLILHFLCSPNPTCPDFQSQSTQFHSLQLH